MAVFYASPRTLLAQISVTNAGTADLSLQGHRAVLSRQGLSPLHGLSSQVAFRFLATPTPPHSGERAAVLSQRMIESSHLTEASVYCASGLQGSWRGGCRQRHWQAQMWQTVSLLGNNVVSSGPVTSKIHWRFEVRVIAGKWGWKVNLHAACSEADRRGRHSPAASNPWPLYYLFPFLPSLI